MMEGKNNKLSVRQQARLLSVNRSSYYYGDPAAESEENLAIMEFMDREYLEHPQSGVQTLATLLVAENVVSRVNPKRIRRLRKKMGLETVYRRPRTTIPGPSSLICPYLLKDIEITRPNQVWCTDITYVPMARGFLYLTVIMDWYSRRILGWRLSNTLDRVFCLEALQAAAEAAGTTPEILNTDQGCQYTSYEWLDVVVGYGIKPSMDGKRRWIDNVMVERFWRTIKYDEIYLHAYGNGRDAERGIARFIRYYNTRRPHQSLATQTPDAVYFTASQEVAA